VLIVTTLFSALLSIAIPLWFGESALGYFIANFALPIPLCVHLLSRLKVDVLPIFATVCALLFGTLVGMAYYDSSRATPTSLKAHLWDGVVQGKSVAYGGVATGHLRM
jgi:hypothetical protein